MNGTRTWRPRVAPGTYVARLRAHRRTVARFTVTVTGATPVAATASGVFPVQGAYTFGDGFGVKRTGHTHQGVDVLAAEGTPLVSPVTGSVTFRKVQPSGAGHYLIIRDRNGVDYAFMHLVAGSELVERGDAVEGRAGDREGRPHRRRPGLPPALRDVAGRLVLAGVLRGRPHAAAEGLG